MKAIKWLFALNRPYIRFYMAVGHVYRNVLILLAASKVENVEPTDLILADDKSHISALTYSPDGQILYNSGFDASIKAWSAHSHEHLFTLHGHENCANVFAFPPLESTLMSASSDGTVRVWDVNEMSEKESSKAHSRPVVGLRFAPGYSMYATSSYDGSIKFWSWPSHEQLGKIQGKKREVGHIVFAKGGDTLITGGIGDYLSLWTVPAGEKLGEYPIAGGGTAFMRAIDNGKKFLTVGFDAQCTIWSTELMEPISSFPVDGQGYFVSGLSKDQRMLAVGKEHSLVLYSLPEGENLITLTAKPKSISCPTFSPDGKTIVAGAADKHIRFWDLSSLF